MGGGGRGSVAMVCVFFFTKNSNLKKKFFKVEGEWLGQI